MTRNSEWVVESMAEGESYEKLTEDVSSLLLLAVTNFGLTKLMC